MGGNALKRTSLWSVVSGQFATAMDGHRTGGMERACEAEMCGETAHPLVVRIAGDVPEGDGAIVARAQRQFMLNKSLKWPG